MTAPWLFPAIGVYYFLTHRFLWPIVQARFFSAIILSAVVLAILFVWTYLPQVAFLSLWHGRGAWLNATFLVLGEGAAITALLFEAFFVDESLVDTFDAVLLAEGHGALVEKARPVEAGTNPLQRLGKPMYSSVYSPFSTRQIVEFILLLPLNFVPWIGAPLFLWLTGYRAGPLHHHRYFKLKEYSRDERKDFVKKRRLNYTGFGSVALILQLIPVLSMLFLITSAIGSALWAAAIENQRLDEQTTAPPAQGNPPQYTEYEDDPV